MALSPKTNVVKTVPAPVGGLNARDAYSAMPPTDAVALINWIPDAGGVRCRKGFKEWAINFTSSLPVRSIISWMGPSSTYPSGIIDNPTQLPGKVFAATDGAIFDITSTTNAPSSAQALSGTTYAGWLSSSMLTNTAGAYLLVVSETDGYYHYNGTTWVKPTMGAGAGQINGVDPANFCYVLVWKRRAWFIEKNTTKAWYLATDSITGTASAFDFGPLMKNGGHLSYLASWTIDAGEGVDDFFVAVGSNGDVMVYKGTDPSSAANFALVGTWSVGQIPVGRRAHCQYGGDLVLASADGIFPISHITRGGTSMLVAASKEYSSKIRARIGPELREGFTSRGWDMFLHPSERMLVISTDNERRQYAMNTTVNEWCEFDGIPITCFCASGGYALVGTSDSRVLLAFFGYADEVPYGGASSAGNGIYGVIHPAYNTFEFPALHKLFHMIRPTFLGVAEPGIRVDMGVDYMSRDVTRYPLYTAEALSLWDTGIFDQSTFGSSSGRPYTRWYGTPGLGVAGSPIIHTACAGDTLLTAIDYLYDVGGVM